MRAGYYAEFEGRAYQCSNPHGARIDLYEDASLPRPDGFEPADWGVWRRLVERHEVTRLTVVRAMATWQGLTVRVERVLEGSREAVVEHQSWPPPDRPNVWSVENGLWQARVPLDTLTDVVEETVDVPL